MRTSRRHFAINTISVVAVMMMLSGCAASLFNGRSNPKVKIASLKTTNIVAENKPEQKKSLNAFEICICGAVATAFGDFVMHPVDTIKIVQQSSETAIGVLGAAKQILQKFGPLGFYQGVVPYLIADGLSGAVKFATFEVAKQYVEDRVPEKYHGISNFLCAAGAMIACSFILVPGEVLKTRMQAGVVKSLGEGISQIFRTEGLKGFYAGYYALIVRDIPYTMMELGLYENTKALIRKVKAKTDLSGYEEFIAAAFTGGTTSFLTTPLDLIKTKLMMQSSSGGTYGGVSDALASLYKQGGIDGLFVGSFARVAWLLPFTVIYLAVYEAAKRKTLELKKTM